MSNADARPDLIERTFVIARHFAPEEGLAPFRLRLCMADGEQGAMCWMPPPPGNLEEYVAVADVALVRCVVEGRDDWLAAAITHFPESGILELIPNAFGADASIVERFRDVVDRIECRSLVRLIERVWSRQRVFRPFWTCPASRSHRHAWRGGLAAHSVEMAEGIANSITVSGSDRDFGIAGALLHDIGKLWCYDENPDRFDVLLGHELVAVMRLKEDLDQLEDEWPDGATAMRALLAGRWALKDHRPLLAVGRLLQAEDQISVERDLRASAKSSQRPWRPATSSNIYRIRAHQ